MVPVADLWEKHTTESIRSEQNTMVLLYITRRSVHIPPSFLQMKRADDLTIYMF